jgi:hypothetical protein
MVSNKKKQHQNAIFNQRTKIRNFRIIEKRLQIAGNNRCNRNPAGRGNQKLKCCCTKKMLILYKLHGETEYFSFDGRKNYSMLMKNLSIMNMKKYKFLINFAGKKLINDTAAFKRKNFNS